MTLSEGSAAAPPAEVLLVGSGYGALKTAEDLAQSGIPVAWVTRTRFLLELPKGMKKFENLPADLDYQFRPLYLRVTHHPLVRTFPRARIESIEDGVDGYKTVIVQDPVFVDPGLCTGCGRCREVCPLGSTPNTPLARVPAYYPSRTLELDKRKPGPCRSSCPLGVNVQAYVALAGAGRFDEALAVIRQENPLPGVCGRVCHHPCEEVCRRGELDEAVAIRDIKRFLFQYEAEHGRPELAFERAREREETVAIVGSGPAGLCAAYFLLREGFGVTVFETLPQPGGMLRAGINAFRLPREVLDAEIEALVAAGMELQTNTPVSSIPDLFGQGFTAVLLATGANRDIQLELPGAELTGVVHCVEFLAELNVLNRGSVGAKTVVIGGGNSAMDAARVALRLGAEEVTVCAIEKRQEMPAAEQEIREAVDEGIRLELGYAPVRFEGNGQVERVVLRPAHWEFGEGPPRIVFESEDTVSLEADSVIVSIGQRPDLEVAGLAGEIETARGGKASVGDASQTSHTGVFAAGDLVTGASTVIGSMASGRKAAADIVTHLIGEPASFLSGGESRGVGEHESISEELPQQRRREMAFRQPRVRRHDFDEIGLGLTELQAVHEARRCLQCGVCCECEACVAECSEVGAIDHCRAEKTVELSNPAIVVANQEELPDSLECNDDGILRADNIQYSNDIFNVLVGGSSVAGRAMAKSANLRQEPIPDNVEPLSFPREMRIGVAICTCNGTMAPEGALEEIVAEAGRHPQIERSEAIFSLCHASGADRIAEMIEAHGLTRVIVASCVCCPLDFHCISCNDQRTRAKAHLFSRRALRRCRFEMINLRDHLLAPTQSKEEVVSRARHLLSNAFIRSQCAEPMQMGHKKIGRRVVILGGSEIGISCARNLSHQGAGKDWHIRLAHQCSLPGSSLPETVRGRPSMNGLPPDVEQFQEVEVEAIEGHLGDFTVVLKEGGKRRRWQADVVCLTDENLLPLSPQEEQEGLRSFYRYDFAFFQSPRLGLYRVLPNVVGSMQAFQAGSALAAEVATKTAEAYLQDHLISPRVDPELCRGCGRCEQICPFDTVKMVENDHGYYSAEVLRHNCVGCGGCVSRCPVTAKNMPYFSNRLLDDMLAQSVAADIAAKRASLVAITCSWNPYACFNAAGAEQLQVPPNFRMIQVMCIGRINQAMILKAFENGADGVILLGCKDEDCRYGAGPKIGHANIRRVRKLLHLLGVGQERLVERAFSAHETTKLTDALWDFAELIESLGSNPAKPSLDRTLDASRAD